MVDPEQNDQGYQRIMSGLALGVAGAVLIGLFIFMLGFAIGWGQDSIGAGLVMGILAPAACLGATAVVCGWSAIALAEELVVSMRKFYVRFGCRGSQPVLLFFKIHAIRRRRYQCIGGLEGTSTSCLVAPSVWLAWHPFSGCHPLFHQALVRCSIDAKGERQCQDKLVGVLPPSVLDRHRESLLDSRDASGQRHKDFAFVRRSVVIVAITVSVS